MTRVTTAGQRHDSLAFELVLDKLAVRRPARGRPRCRPDAVLADKAYSSKAIRGHLRNRRIKAVIPLKSDQIAAHQRRGTGGQLPGLGSRQPAAQHRGTSDQQAPRHPRGRHPLRQRDFVYRGTIDVAAIRIWLRDPVVTDLRDTP